MTHDEIAEIAFNVIRAAHERGITDPLRLAHAVAVAIQLALADERAELAAARQRRTKEAER